VHVWKLKEEKTCEEYRCMVGEKVEEANWKGLLVRSIYGKYPLNPQKIATKGFSTDSGRV